MAYANYISLNGRVYGFNDDVSGGQNQGSLVDLGPDLSQTQAVTFDRGTETWKPDQSRMNPYQGGDPLASGNIVLMNPSINPLTGEVATHGELSYLARAGLSGNPGGFGSRFQSYLRNGGVHPYFMAAIGSVMGAGELGLLGGGEAGGGAAAASAAGGAGAVESAAFGSAPVLADVGLSAGAEIPSGLMAGTTAGGAGAVEAAAFGGGSAAEGATSAGSQSGSSIARNLATKAPGLLSSLAGGSGGGGGKGLQAGNTLGVGGSNEVGGGEAGIKAMQMTPVNVQSTYNPYAPITPSATATAGTYANPATVATSPSTQSPLIAELVERSKLGNTLWGGGQQQQSAYLQDYMRRKNAFDILSFFNALA